MNNRALGNTGENRAAIYLSLRLYRILERNYSAPTGEIDIIAYRGGTYIFVEVKYRRDNKKGYPAEAVTPAKQSRIRRTAENYLIAHNVNIDSASIRYDVIEILGKEIKHIKAAF